MFKKVFPLVVIVLSGCGGSGSEPESTFTSPPAALTINGSTSAVVGDSVDFAVAAPSGSTITAIDWTVSGLDTPPLSAHTQAIGFDVSIAGEYLISASATFSSGDTLTQTATLNVVEGSAPEAVLRLGHEASEGGRVSLHVDNTSTKTVTNIAWAQLSGPTITAFSEDDDELSYNLYFQAPSVTSDDIIEIEATLTYEDGSSARDSTQIVVKNISIGDEAFFVDFSSSVPETVTTHMQAYQSDSPYASALNQCVYNNQVADSCTFSTLPLVGQMTESPTIDDILDRTYVSHPWMGDAFKEFLETSDSAEDMLNLLRATTAVVISYDIRPSFYWAVTGAIYLDANNFWRTPQERDTLNTIPDYRSGFGNDLNYTTYWRYVRDGEYYYPQPGLSAASRATRTQAGVDAALTWLMYHELGHANDFFDYTKWSSLSDNDSPLAFVNRNSPLSPGLTSTLPLNSSQLHGLAQVRYGGNTATATQRNYAAQQVANWFEEDGASSFYSYYTEREDFATLMERFMMLYRMGVSADTGVFTSESVDTQTYDVSWGQRDRINDSNLQLRVNYVVSRVLPQLDVTGIQDSLPSPQLFPANSSWFNTLNLDNTDVRTQFTEEEKSHLIEQHEQLAHRDHK